MALKDILFASDSTSVFLQDFKGFHFPGLGLTGGPTSYIIGPDLDEATKPQGELAPPFFFLESVRSGFITISSTHREELTGDSTKF